MNWWAAFNWCDSVGGSLASFGEMCPKIPTAVNNTTGACPGLQGKGSDQWVWSSLGFGSSYALVVDLSSGMVSQRGRNSNYYCALCE